MKVTFLGTGTSQGVPVIACSCDVCRSLDFRDKRLRTSIHVEVEGIQLVVDTGPDFRQQMLQQRINHLDAVLFTHAHRDHTAGLDDVRAYNFLQKMDMPVYAKKGVLAQLKTEYAYAFAEATYPGLPRLRLMEITDAPFKIGTVQIIPLPVMHMKLPVTGFRIGNFSYITDANHIPDETVAQLEGSQVLVLNALQKQPHVSHFNLEEALKQVERIRAKHTYFTHISHKMGPHADVSKELPTHVSLAYDGLQVIC